MAQEHPRLKLGKRAAFVKTHLKRLPQQAETWEVDFRALPRPAGQSDTHYLGLAVALPRGDPLAYLPVEYTPTVNDLADLLADHAPAPDRLGPPAHAHALPGQPSLGRVVPAPERTRHRGHGEVGQWVQESGWIEVGQRKEAGFVARALDDAGVVFENNSSTTLAEAMAALEEGLAGRVKGHEVALRSSSPKAGKTQRRPPNDA